MDSGLAKIVWKIHKNKEGRFNEEISNFAKKLRLKWKESMDKTSTPKS